QGGPLSPAAPMAKEDPGPQPAEGDAPLPAGFIFRCDGATKPECFRYRVLGLPRRRLGAVSRIRRGAALFLYDFDARYLYGPYRADSDGGRDLEPAAFEGRLPAQVKFMIDGDFMPVPGKIVRYTIKENYPGKFLPELTFAQVEKLRALFRPITSLPVPEAPPLHYVGNSHSAPSAAFLLPSASSSDPTQPAAYVPHPSAYVLTPAAQLVPNEPYACPDSHLPAPTAQFATPAYYVTTTAHPYQAGYQAYGASPATYHYTQAPPLQLVYVQAQHPVPEHVTDPACSSEPNYDANGNDPYRFDAVKSQYLETTSGRAAAPHEVAAKNPQLVMHCVYAPGSECATGETTQSSAEGAASAVYSHVGAPAITQAAPLVYAVAAAPHEVAGTNLQLVMHYGYAPGSEVATGETTQSSAERAASAIYSHAGAPATTQAAPSVYAVAAAPANL
uniref:DCD domain-containing protein n=4 Tax=Aegilops tauschii TaxID=37682 RepID=A0A453MAS2_AEGTS